MTVRSSLLIATLVAVPVALSAQEPTAASPAPVANPISTSQSKIYAFLGGVVVSAAEKMPEENYSFKPTPDVRSFGQLVGHLADAQVFFCSTATGDTKTPPGPRRPRPPRPIW